MTLSDLCFTVDMATIEASEYVRNWLRTAFADAEPSNTKAVLD
jgi:hypothetical protein